MKETNMEHFRSEIEELLESGNGFLPAIIDNKPAYCSGRQCDECPVYRQSESCSMVFVKWLMSEYKPEPVLTAREKHFVEFAQKGWLSRNENGTLMWHQDKPCKSNIMWFCHANQFCLNGFADTFPFITWEDEEPWSVSDLRKLKSLEYNPEDVAFKGGVSDE